MFGRRRTQTGITHRLPPMPSAADIEQRVRRARPGITLYQSGNDWKEFQYGGDTYFIPPDLTQGGTVEPPLVAHPAPPPEKRNDEGQWMVPADGCLRVRDRYGDIWKEPTGGQAGKRMLARDTMAMSAMDMMSFIIAHHPNEGIVVLSGDPVEDAQYREAAAAQEEAHMLRMAKSIVRTRREQIMRWERDPKNAGQRFPPPKDFEQDAQEYLDEHEESLNEVRGRYVCDCGGFQSDDFEKFRRHMKVSHNQFVTQDQADANALTPAKPVSEALLDLGEQDEGESLDAIDREKRARPIPPSALRAAAEAAERAASRKAVDTPRDLGEKLNG